MCRRRLGSRAAVDYAPGVGRSEALGELEHRVLDLLWDRGPVPVREVARLLGGTRAYTTVMTTLDRLFKKGLLARDKDGIAFVYRPACSREAFHRRLVEAAVTDLLSRATEPVLAGFIDAAASID